MKPWSAHAWLSAWHFAARTHGEQRVPGSDISYLTHVGAVAMEVARAIAGRLVQMRDNLAPIRGQPPELAMVKLADRITNLQPPPPHWSTARICDYREEAREIHAALGDECPVLGPRLLRRIEAYGTG